VQRGDVLLVDLWAKEPRGIYADQTWMASVGSPSDKVVQVWEAVRDARDAALALLRDRIAQLRAARTAKGPRTAE
jgi:Xaa-Pro aminopeptidase